MDQAPTPQQRSILDAIQTTSDNLVIEALAGTGKSTTLRAALGVIPQKSVLVIAFNKRIAEEFSAKMPPAPRGSAFVVKTFHALGLSIIKKHFPHLKISGDATSSLINQAAEEIEELDGHKVPFRIKRGAAQLLRQLKETVLEIPDPKSLQWGDLMETLALDYNVLNDYRDIVDATRLTRLAYVIGTNLAQRQSIDFCDMVWAPVALDLAPPSRFKAVFVDELQDISGPQFALIRKVMVPDGRFVGVGDLRQTIYGFRGAMGADAWDIAQTDLNARRLPLTVTWRCSQAVVREAQELVPSLTAAPGALPGTVDETDLLGMIDQLEDAAIMRPPSPEIDTFVLSRNNATLIDCAFKLYRHGCAFQLNAGDQMLDPLFVLLDRKLNLSSKQAFNDSLRAWETQELQRAEKAGASGYAERVEEQAAMLRVAAHHAQPSEIKRLLQAILKPGTSGVMLSTVHKVKGLEADTVYLLAETFARHAPSRACRPCQGAGCEECEGTGRVRPTLNDEELNIEYVAITRARRRLVWMTGLERPI